MAASHAFPASTIAARPRRVAASRDPSRAGFEALPTRLVGGGAVLGAGALAAFAALRCSGLLDLDAMTLLPAAALAGAAAMSLGTALACLRALGSAPRRPPPRSSCRPC